jgi:hypothetical protein
MNVKKPCFRAAMNSVRISGKVYYIWSNTQKPTITLRNIIETDACEVPLEDARDH